MAISRSRDLSKTERRGWEFWLKSHYPCVICNDRYMGAYSSGIWTAFTTDEVPIEAYSDDVTCAQFWDEFKDHFVGKGDTPQEAFEDLKGQIEKAINEGRDCRD